MSSDGPCEVKEDDTKEWGQAWLKAKVKAKRLGA